MKVEREYFKATELTKLVERLTQIGFDSAKRSGEPITYSESRRWAKAVLNGTVEPEQATNNPEGARVLRAIRDRALALGWLKGNEEA